MLRVRGNAGHLGQPVPARARRGGASLNISERARLRELERENRELRMKTEFLGKVTAFFAQEYR